MTRHNGSNAKSSRPNLENRAYRKTQRQAADMLKISPRTVRHYLDIGRLRWSGNQVFLDSILEELDRRGLDKRTAGDSLE